MKTSRRMKRMARKDRKGVALSLTSLMDVFTNLVFFLLLSQGVTNVDEPPKEVKLPDSYTDAKPRPTVQVLVSEKGILVQGEPTVSYEEVVAADDDLIVPVRDKLAQIKSSAMGLSEQTQEATSEVTILAHNAVPFKVMKRLMSSCANAGYSKISLAVNQKTDVAPR